MKGMERKELNRFLCGLEPKNVGSATHIWCRARSAWWALASSSQAGDVNAPATKTALNLQQGAPGDTARHREFLIVFLSPAMAGAFILLDDYCLALQLLYHFDQFDSHASQAPVCRKSARVTKACAWLLYPLK
jgi:hypothetical protein